MDFGAMNRKKLKQVLNDRDWVQRFWVVHTNQVILRFGFQCCTITKNKWTTKGDRKSSITRKEQSNNNMKEKQHEGTTNKIGKKRKLVEQWEENLRRGGRKVEQERATKLIGGCWWQRLMKDREQEQHCALSGFEVMHTQSVGKPHIAK